MPKKRSFNPEGVSKPISIFSRVVTVESPARLIFLSGSLARDAAGNLVGVNDIKAQTRQVLTNLRTCVEAAGGRMEDILCVTVFVTNIKHFQEIHQVRAEFWKNPEDYPTSTMVEVKALAHPDALIEINAIAAV